MEVLQRVTVEPIRFIFTMALAMQYRATRALILRKVCISSHNQTLCGIDEDSSGLDSDMPDGQTVRDDVATWCFYLDACANLLGALVSCVYGSASDRFGRRGLLVLPSLGLMLGSASYFIHYYFLQLPLYYVFFSSALMGLFGYYQASYIATMSYICDITDHSDRSFRLGVMESMGLIGGPVGMMLASALLYVNYDGLVYFIIILSQGVVLLYVRYWLQETIDVRAFQEVNSQDANCSPQKICSDVSWSLKRTLMVYVIWRTENRRQLLLINQTVGILSSLGSSGEMDLTRLYTSSPPLSWADSTLLAYLSVKDAVKGMILAVGIPLLFLYFSHWTIRLDMIIAMTTLLSTSASLVLRAFASSTLMMMLVPVVGCLGGFPNTLISSIKCKLVDPDEFGALFACTMLIQSICHVVGRVFFQMLYAATLTIWPRLPFLGMGIFFVMLLSIITYMWCLSGHLDKKDKTDARQQLINSYDGNEEEIELFSAKTK
ncbi:proton-coupled folate transporter-like [Patiria miniata]|uniref:Proton-coupled folate transporter n=1 Tax=Patiria miniata TaxID=46514 RepID=A0A914BGA0_PATMI|nr:proton-coupled folate transporter-like [Patiria miniata]